MSGFKFTNYAYAPDPEFDDYTFVKFEELKSQIIIFDTEHIRIGDDFVKFAFRYNNSDVVYCSYTKSKSIVNTLKNIMETEGLIPAVPVMIGTYPTALGKDGYCFVDVDN